MKHNCSTNCDKCVDMKCKAIHINNSHPIRWTKKAKLAIKTLFDDFTDLETSDEDIRKIHLKIKNI